MESNSPSNGRVSVNLAIRLVALLSAGGASGAAWHLPDDMHDGGLIVLVIALSAIGSAPVSNFITNWLEKRRADKAEDRAIHLQTLNALSKQTAILERIDERLAAQDRT